jgi:hypothetical protein
MKSAEPSLAANAPPPLKPENIWRILTGFHEGKETRIRGGTKIELAFPYNLGYENKE